VEQFGNSVDVLVVGGGTAGCIAAIQAARLGARTMLLEAGTQLGGTMTTGGVSFPGLFHAWGRQVIAGIGWELVLRAVELDGGVLPDFSLVPDHHWQHQVQINGPLYAALAEETCLDAGVELCLYEFPTEGEQTPEGWRIVSAGKGLSREVHCRQLIDCTGGADVVGLLGFSRLRDAETQPGTLVFRIDGYDIAQLDADDIQSRYEAALAEGTLRKGDLSNPNAPFISFLASGGGSANHQFGADSSTAATHTRANIEGRRCALRLLRFIRSMPGCEQARLASMQPETAVRETWRIAGEAQITEADYTRGRVFDDAICFAFYPIDLPPAGADSLRKPESACGGSQREQ